MKNDRFGQIASQLGQKWLGAPSCDAANWHFEGFKKQMLFYVFQARHITCNRFYTAKSIWAETAAVPRKQQKMAQR